MTTLIDPVLDMTDYAWVKDGMTVWASAYRSGNQNKGPKLRQKPVRGVAMYGRYEPAGYVPGQPYPATRQKANYFTPFRKGTTEPAWSRTIAIRSRDIAETEAGAVKNYNDRVLAEIKETERRLAELKAAIIT